MEPLNEELEEGWLELGRAYLVANQTIRSMIPLVVDYAESLKKQLDHKRTSWSALNHKGKNQRDELDRQQKRLQKQKREMEQLTLENQRLKQLAATYAQQLTVQAMAQQGYTVKGEPGQESFERKPITLVPGDLDNIFEGVNYEV